MAYALGFILQLLRDRVRWVLFHRFSRNWVLMDTRAARLERDHLMIQALRVNGLVEAPQ